MALMIRSVFLMGFVYYLLSTDGYNLLVVNFVGGLTDQVAILAMPDGTTTQNGFLDFSNTQLNILSNTWESIKAAGFGISQLTWAAWSFLQSYCKSGMPFLRY